MAARADHAPKFDGTLEDPLWATAPTVSDFRQREPLETQAATERTEVHILYDSRHVYFGIRCYDRDPKAIVATQLRQDISQDFDDNFAIMIDPTLSHRSGYIFEVNPLGTQRDGEIIEEQAPPQTDSIVDCMNPPRVLSCCARNVFLPSWFAQYGADAQGIEPVAGSSSMPSAGAKSRHT